MKLSIEKEERDLLVGLVESRISELHPEIRRSMDHTYKDELKQELERFEAFGTAQVAGKRPLTFAGIRPGQDNGRDRILVAVEPHRRAGGVGICRLFLPLDARA